MGFAARRAIEQFQQAHFPALEREIHEAAGFPLVVDIAWAQLAQADVSHTLYDEAWRKVYFEPTIAALKRIGQTTIGKMALRSGLSRVEFRNSKDTAYAPSAVSYADGTLTIDHKLSNVGYVDDRMRAIVDVLENGL